MQKLPSLTIFLPAYNEQDNIKNTIDQALKAAKKLAKDYEILIINDGSKDKTAEVVKNIKNKNLSLVSHQENKGYGAAIKTGLKNAKMDWVFFTDSDGQFKFDELEKFVKNRGKGDLIIGYRKKRQDPLHRIFIAQVLLRIWNYLLFGLNVKDVDCAYKLFPSKILQDIDLKTESAITETEFLVRAKNAGYSFHEMPVTHYPREHGKQTGGNFKVILAAVKDSFNLFKDTFNFKESLPNLILLLLLALGLFLRLFRIGNTLNFHHDEGRDVLVAAKMLLKKRPTLIGPQTSMGNMYLGPLYYSLIAPFLLPILL